MSIESIVNQSLDLIGYKRHIGTIWDGSPAARVALNAYAETRDEMLGIQPWMFARAFYTLEPRMGASGEMFAFTRPASAIVVLDVFPADPDPLAPEPCRWLETYFDGERIILSPAVTAVAAVTDRVLNPNDWPPDFTMVVIQSLARRLQHLIPGGGGGEKPDDTGRHSK